MRVRRELLILGLLVLVAALLPLGLADNDFVMRILILALVYAVVGSAWDLIMGYAGVFTFGQIAFFGIGAYTTAILTTQHGVSPWLGMLLAGVLTGIVGVLIGLPCLRLKGSYVALLTFGVQMLFSAFVVGALGTAIGTRGSAGILGIPPLSLFGQRFNSLELVPWYYVALVLFVLSLLVIYRLIFSHAGTAFVALRDDERRAMSLGVDAFRYKLLVFAASAFLTGVIGAFYAHYTGVVSVRIVGLDMFIMIMVMQVAGGLGVFPGTALAAFPILFVNEYLRFVDVYRPMVFGLLVVLLVLFLPHGVLGTLSPQRGSTALTRFSVLLWRRTGKPQVAATDDTEDGP